MSVLLGLFEQGGDLIALLALGLFITSLLVKIPLSVRTIAQGL